MNTSNQPSQSGSFLNIPLRYLTSVAVALLAVIAACASQTQTPIPIILATDATPPEVTAANELAAYFGKMTGEVFPVLTEADAWIPWSCAVYVGPTAFAKTNGVNCATLGAEEWALKSVGQNLIVAGGRPRGTLYAAYRLLEDNYGVRWWNPWEETVPKCASLVLPSVDLRKKPTFDFRSITIYGPGGPHGQGGGPFCARNRINNNNGQITKEYGGEMGYGPPYLVHTLNFYCPAPEYYDKHPEWFALVNGKRAHGAHNTYNLCLTNPELRKFMLERLRGYIAKSRSDAEKTGRPAPLMFDVSRNEAASCECPNCKELATREGSEAGPLLDLVNYLADNIRAQYPDVFIHTLGYCETQKPPKTIKARDNVIVQLCDDYSFHGKPITDPDNTPFREILLSWLPVCKNLHMWRYGISYGPYAGGPFASAQAYGPDMRFYAEHNVKGVFQEHEGGIPDDMRDFKLWMLAKLMEDPCCDYQKLLVDFTDGYYGPAGSVIREYLKALQTAQEAGTPPTTFSAPLHLTHLDGPFLVKAHGMFDRAEKSVQDDPVLLRRVRHARLSLDRVTLALFNNLTLNWDGEGPMPLDREAIAARAKDIWLTMIKLRFPQGLHALDPAHIRHVDPTLQKSAVESEITKLLAPRIKVALPEQFRSLPKGCVWDYTPEDFRISGYKAPTVPDKDAETGVTVRLELADEATATLNYQRKPKLPMPWGLYDLRYKLPMPWELYETQHAKGITTSSNIVPESISGPGYHWYKLPTVALSGGGYYVYFQDLFIWCPVIQCDLNIPKSRPAGKYDIWARIKFEGPGFPHRDAAQKNAISVERVVVVKSQ